VSGEDGEGSEPTTAPSPDSQADAQPSRPVAGRVCQYRPATAAPRSTIPTKKPYQTGDVGETAVMMRMIVKSAPPAIAR